MPHGAERRGQPARVLWWLVLGIFVSGASSVEAQELSLDRELSLKRDYPGSGPYVCPDVTIPAPPPAEERLQATQLASSADQALVQGDLTRAASLLERAIELDPSSAELAYRRGRVLEDLGDRPAAIDAYCRVVAAGATDYTRTDAQARLQALADARWAGISDEAADAFRIGLSAADLGRFSDAAESFGAALAEAPEWAEAVFNRAIMFDRLGRQQEALIGLRRYLELRPDAADAVSVSVRIGLLEGVSTTAPSPGTALTLGLLVPGLGQFYSDRNLGGLTFLSLAGGAVAAGFLIKEVEVECLTTVDPAGDCPPGQVYRENVDRPYLGAGLAAAGGVAVIGAIEAFIKARRGEPDLSSLSPSPEPGELRLAWPSFTQRGTRVDFNVVRVTF